MRRDEKDERDERDSDGLWLIFGGKAVARMDEPSSRS